MIDRAMIYPGFEEANEKYLSTRDSHDAYWYTYTTSSLEQQIIF